MIKIGMMIVDRYEILEKIGTGGMSDVYKAKDHKLNRFVAVKVLKHGLVANTYLWVPILFWGVLSFTLCLAAVSRL